MIRFVEGPIEPIACVEKDAYTRCKDLKFCIFRDVWKEIADAISVVVDTVTFEELVERYKARSQSARPVYEYSI